ncbi:MAG: carboxymuconolactone decarboxylase family protein [Acidimicrobiia bacterium]
MTDLGTVVARYEAVTGDELVAFAPEVFDRFFQLEHLLGRDPAARLLAPVLPAVAATLRLPGPVVGAPAGPVGAGDPRVAFAEQFVVDVSRVSDEQRSALHATLGEEAVPFVQALFVTDYTRRVRHVLGRLFPGAALVDPAAGGRDGGELVATAFELMPAVVRLPGPDPVLRELVRLRIATQHNCRQCRSLRTASAVQAAGGLDFFDGLESYEDRADLSSRDRVALGLVDAVLWQPADVGDDRVAEVRAAFTPAEATELVLFVLRCAWAKVTVSLGRDAARVTEGVEMYDVDEATGEVVWLERA